MTSTSDARLRAFLSGTGPEVFHSIQGRNGLWQKDPFDVEEIHDEARAEFERLLSRALATTRHDAGRILLMLGDSGCGKTHLVRAFRDTLQESSRGYLGYMQMTTGVTSYPRYLLSNLIESLDQVYNAYTDVSGLQHLSNALFAACPSPLKDLLTDPEQLSGEEEVHELVGTLADALLARADFTEAKVALDLVRALLYLQRREDTRLRHRVLKYLRCEDLSGPDRALLGGLVPRTSDTHPMEMVRDLAALMGALGQALVLAVDQVEDSYEEGDPRSDAAFRAAVQTLREVADRAPRCVVVLACLHAFWERQSQKLPKSLLDRVVKDPRPVSLENLRSTAEARLLAERRLRVLYEEADVDFNPAEGTFPYPPEGFAALDRMRTRDVLDALRTWREEAVRTGRLPARFPLEDGGSTTPLPGTVVLPPPPPAADFDGLWNDFRSEWRQPPPEEDGPLLEILGRTLGYVGEELGREVRTRLGPEGAEVDVGGGGEQLLVALCNKSSRGGHLGKQLERLQSVRQQRIAVAVRTAAWPDTPRTAAVEQLGRLIGAGGRRTILEDADVRAAMAFEAFRARYSGHPGFASWLRQARPLSHLRSVDDILRTDALLRQAPPAITPPAAPPAAPLPRAESPKGPPAPAPAPGPSGSVTATVALGTSGGLLAEPVEMRPSDLIQHAAVLGGSGSGKTTLALNVIEQLLLQGVPAILLDRKGDLAGYAREGLAGLAPGDAARTRRLEALASRVDVSLFTPGDVRGRALTLPLLPSGLAKASEHEREEASLQAAHAVGDMLNYQHKGRDEQCRTVLAQALGLLASVAPEDGTPSLEDVIRFIELQDPSLLQRVGRLDQRVLKKLVEDLETFRLNNRALLSEDGERLDVDQLLGRGAHARPGRTRLSIISTKGLKDTNRVLFWVAQLLGQVARWCGQHPSTSLQALLFLDEADLYMPAVGKPATKPMLEGLLKRARSAGVGIMLGTQSPGDLDYKGRDNIRTWFVGRVREENSLKKLRPLLSDAGAGLEKRLPNQQTGEFLVLRGGAPAPLKAAPSGLSTEQLPDDELLRLASHRTGA
jgi:DNA helicase HerA-like ATPase/energy-coupling factor transporter ATP-binding protein EcfA2